MPDIPGGEGLKVQKSGGAAVAVPLAVRIFSHALKKNRRAERAGVHDARASDRRSRWHQRCGRVPYMQADALTTVGAEG